VLFAGGVWIWKGRVRPAPKSPPTASASRVGAAAGVATPSVAKAPEPTRVPDASTREPQPAAAPPESVPPAVPAVEVGTVIVTPVDAHGLVVPGKASLAVRPVGSTEQAPSVHALLDKNHPQLRLERAPTGDDEIEVTLEDRPSGTLTGRAAVRETELTALTLRYGGPDPATSICVRLDRAIVDAPPIATFTAADATSISPAFVRDSQQFLVASPVGPGPYTLRIEDPRWKPVRVDDLHASDAIEVELIGSATLRVVVRHKAGGPAIAGVKFTFGREEDGTILDAGVDHERRRQRDLRPPRARVLHLDRPPGGDRGAQGVDLRPPIGRDARRRGPPRRGCRNRDHRRRALRRRWRDAAREADRRALRAGARE
jgi:hypothetical protein